jgi:CDGSH-type Zn-finger protein
VRIAVPSALLQSEENNMSERKPHIPRKSPCAVAVEAGKSYWFCTCGKSAGQPLCDGSHKGTGFIPKEYKADKSETVYFCGCKHSGGNGMTCDGSHQKL